MSVGLLVVRLLYRFYVSVYLSKWFVFVLLFKFWSACCLVDGRSTIGYGPRIGDGRGFLLVWFFWKREILVSVNCQPLPAGRQGRRISPPGAKALLAAGYILSLIFVIFSNSPIISIFISE